jgi:PBSX family phage portal protein
MNDTNKKVLKNVKARVVEVRKQFNTQSKSTKANDDPLVTLGESGKVIEAPFDPFSLTLMLERCTELGPSIEAMEVNIDGFGHRFVPRTKSDPRIEIPDEIRNEIKKENIRLQNFFENCTEESFISFRRKLRKDLETTGMAYFEVIRSQTGSLQRFVHMPSYQVRLGKKEDEQVLAKRKIYELQENGSVKIKTMKYWTRFRTYVQSRLNHRHNLEIVPSDRIVWFKEFGDERILNNKTGEFDPNTKPENMANEIICLSLYSARSSYGLPRYIGSLLSMFGDRAAEEINYTTFQNNNIPSMALLCSNGQVTEGTIQRIESFLESQVQGSNNYSKILIVEAEGEEEGEEGNQIKLDLKPLTREQHTDALFQEYSKNNKENVRKCFRMPPIFIGSTDDYNKSTADISRRITDEQVFAPERSEFDSLMNKKIMPELGAIYHKYTSNSPNTTDNEQLVKMLATSEKTGGMTPYIARKMLEEILGRDLPEFKEEFDPHVPFSLTMAEAVKNKADPTEPGQQVTAIKNLEESNMLVQLAKNLKERDPLIEHLLEVQSLIEKKWTENLSEEHDYECEDD